jgi:hypothetical protein
MVISEYIRIQNLIFSYSETSGSRFGLAGDDTVYNAGIEDAVDCSGGDFGLYGSGG